MKPHATSLSFSKSKIPFKPIFQAGLLAGTFDITGAILLTYFSNGLGPLAVMKYVASGVLGRGALKGGVEVALLGLLFHYFIALCWAFIFFLMYSKLKLVLKNKYILGLSYGIIVWVVMNLVVLPLSNTPKAPFNITIALLNALILMICIGLPISLVADKYYNSKNS